MGGGAGLLRRKAAVARRTGDGAAAKAGAGVGEEAGGSGRRGEQRGGTSATRQETTAWHGAGRAGSLDPFRRDADGGAERRGTGLAAPAGGV